MGKVLFGRVGVGKTTRVVAIVGGPLEDCMATAKDAVGHGADILEVRVDNCRGHMSEEQVIDLLGQLRDLQPQPALLLTIRKLSEGGYFFSGESQRLNWFRSLLPSVDAVDIELYASKISAQVIEFARKHKKAVIASYHNFEHTPTIEPDWRHNVCLSDLVRDAQYLGVDLLKVATQINSVDDLDTLLDFTDRFASDMLLCTVGMGQEGAISRVVMPMVGSCLSYGYANGQPTVPGQLHVRDLRHLLDQISKVKFSLEEARQILRTAAVSGWVSAPAN